MLCGKRLRHLLVRRPHDLTDTGSDWRAPQGVTAATAAIVPLPDSSVAVELQFCPGLATSTRSCRLYRLELHRRLAASRTQPSG